MGYLLQDVNLSNIHISPNGRTINIEFINMFDGGFLAHLTVEEVLIFKYFNAFDNSEDAFPTYVGEVMYRELIPEESSAELLNFGYRFIGREEQIQSKESLFFIHIEGGEISIDLVCSKYQLHPITGNL
jgi:hypothetical protein